MSTLTNQAGISIDHTTLDQITIGRVTHHSSHCPGRLR